MLVAGPLYAAYARAGLLGDGGGGAAALGASLMLLRRAQ